MATALFLTGCGETSSKKKYDYLVTFNYNVEGLGETNVKTQYLGVGKNSKIVQPGYFGDTILPEYVITGYFNDGWYLAKLDEGGNVIKDGDGRVQVDRKWDFQNDTVTSNITLYANFRRNITCTVVVDGGENKVFNGAPGDVLARPTRKSHIPAKNGYTFIDYYTDATYTTKFDFPYTYTDEDVTCYAKFVEGDWVLVDTVDEFMNVMVNADITQNVYVTAEELDFTGVKFVDLNKNVFFGHNLKSKLYGNGCVFKNMTVEMKCKAKGETYGYSLFNKISATAEIKDVKFENLTVSFTTISGFSLPTDKVALFATEIENGARLTNVSFANCTLSVGGGIEVEVYKYCADDKAGISSTIFDETKLTVTENFETQE